MSDNSTSSQFLLRASHPEHSLNMVPVESPASADQIQLTLLLRRYSVAPEAIEGQPTLTHDEFAETHGASPEDIQLVTTFAEQHGLTVKRVHAGARTVTLNGGITAIAHAFGVDRDDCQAVNKDLQIPEALGETVVGVFGFNQRPTARTNHRVRPHTSQPGGFTPKQLAAAYNFPKGTGAGQTIALVELGGGYNPQDLQNYWKHMGIAPVSVTDVSVDGAANAPTGDPSGPDSEVVLDIEIAGAMAPGANIVVYFAPNTDQGFLNAISTAVHDQQHKPSVISISWGAAEKEWTAQTMNAFNSVFHDAALLGITVLAAAGDNGSSDGEQSDKHVDFPASSPWVVSCGGTRLVLSDNGSITSETVWNDGTNSGATGGGVSAFFARPSYQANLAVPAAPAGSVKHLGRGVPDIAALADPETGYLVFIDGQEAVIGGTSAVAPLWAGLLALCNQQLGKNLGWLHPKLYGTVAQHKVLRDITQGTNGAYRASVGWDCCTGLGTPNGQALLDLLKSGK